MRQLIRYVLEKVPRHPEESGANLYIMLAPTY